MNTPAQEVSPSYRLYWARLFFVLKDKDGSSYEQKHAIQFFSKGAKEAVHSVVLWVHNRQETAPELFGKIAVVQVGFLHFAEIDAKGYLPQAASPMFYEWKEGVTLEGDIFEPASWKLIPKERRINVMGGS